MGLQNIFSNYIYIFILIIVRYIGMFLVAPVFGSRVIPLRVRLSFVLFLSFITIPVLTNLQSVEVPVNPLSILLDLLGEFSVGLTIGFISFLIFAAIQFAGHFMDLSMGFAMANVVDPITGAQAPVLGQFKNILAILLFFAVNGHHILLRAVYHSYKVIPLGEINFSSAAFQYIFNATTEIVEISLLIALPVIGTIFVADIIFGFLARSIPQLNIFIVGLPLKMLLGFLILILSIYFSVYYFQDLFREMYRQVSEIIRIISQG